MGFHLLAELDLQLREFPPFTTRLIEKTDETDVVLPPPPLCQPFDSVMQISGKKKKNEYKISGKLARDITSCMNFLQTGRISLLRVAENIMTCLSCGVNLKIS